ncbi:MAG: polynucleotide adenylyltransferase PcnB [Ferrovum sp. 37-45-19]|uniref:polynucleotide adenylyltransferase PcnB n=1 Tax=Ferrovum sp. JA12 TaxID=1356299 RepID=UPI000702918F|nr:polynucleotide adenylyltransferase PcnB [Ferrovum sp. JA12]OYV79856.1 MAG: polynucleotide adenylyltransferase PcnB [Ferrovum sp. 21-44-67]OYV95480.1 MAG: polynucleotide adenylyltransferase PcnB [Ferrovum sp. 37-45-19]HQT81276.1 polynucleotide adenylyltransferase PcnB [Ferrovaceae bacterium]KRH78163.1 poly(A) polymerase I precursor [Ferrovum sp. JA12]HQU05729.1 polynucleotide adenylyltransferase PcnB [Ferrovaceae bacterium]
MIKKFIAKVFKRPKTHSSVTATVIHAGTHQIDKSHISQCALSVIKQLQESGHQAYIVGGAVRDLLLQQTPKDFDVATSATPEQVKKLIRRSRIIGRRFQIVHVQCGQEIVEVSTFRAKADLNSQHQQADEHGRLTRDNVFGSLEEDAERRDFTINALFYDPQKNIVLDYFNGVKHLKHKHITMIGDPTQRYREDPVRMLRAARFCAKLNFTLDPSCKAPISELSELLLNVPESRLFDELLKILLSGHATKSLEQLSSLNLLNYLIPSLDKSLLNEKNKLFVQQALSNTDLRIKEDMGVSPSFLMATLLWPSLHERWQNYLNKGEKNLPALFAATQDVLTTQDEVLMIPKRFEGTMKEIWGLQPRFEQRSGQRPFRLLQHPRFRAGYDFLVLRSQSGEVDASLAQWWTAFQQAPTEGREALLIKSDKPHSRQRRKPKA